MLLGTIDLSAAGVLFDDSLRSGIREPSLLKPFVLDLERVIDLSSLAILIDECKRRYDNATPRSVTQSDAWLGPRVHCALRLTRLEASIPGLFEYLAAYAFPDYCLWRWGDQYSRASSRDIKKQAFKRLWWAAELFRNGTDYSSATEALLKSDIPNTYLSLLNVHNRGVALALLKYIAEFSIPSRNANALSTQLKTSSVNVALDRAWSATEEGLGIDVEWIQTEPSIMQLLSSPVGPKQGFVSELQLNAVYDALVAIVDLKKVKEYRRGQPHESALEGAG